MRAVLVAVLLGTVATAQVEVQLPRTAAADRLAAWLAAFNARDRVQLRRLRDEGLLPNRPVEQDLDFRDRTGGFQLLRVETSEPTRIVALARELDGEQFAHITVEVEPAPPHRVVRLFGLAIARPPGFPVIRLTERELLDQLSREIERRVNEDQRKR